MQACDLSVKGSVLNSLFQQSSSRQEDQSLAKEGSTKKVGGAKNEGGVEGSSSRNALIGRVGRVQEAIKWLTTPSFKAVCGMQ